MVLYNTTPQDVLLDMCIDVGKDASGGRVIKKATFVWKFLTLLLIAGCGIYMCLIGVDQRFPYEKLSVKPINQGQQHGCLQYSKRSSLGFIQHYPKPIKYDRKECSCTPVHYFVILSMQRSGSGWFETLLNSHPNVSSHGEIFSVKSRRQNFTTISKTLDTVYNLDWKSSAAKNSCTAAVGFKWMLNQGAMEYRREISAYFKRRGVSVIILLRRNVLRRLISVLANAYDREKPAHDTHLAHVHSKEEADKLAAYKPTIDTKYLVGNLQRAQETIRDAFRNYNVTRLTILYYEDLMRDQKILEKIQLFLGVQQRELGSQHVKIHTGPLSQLVTNWKDVYRTLNGTEFQKFLIDEDYL